MSWSYTPAGSDRDRVRFWCGDTDINDQLVQDEEIDDVLTDIPDPKLAAAEICEAIAAQFARLADSSVGDVRESFSQRSAAYRATADRLRRRARVVAAPKFGGLSKSEKEVLDQDTDAVQPSFRIGLGDHPELQSERDGSWDFGVGGYDGDC